jgi:3-isopropylmalate dehydrogenase
MQMMLEWLGETKASAAVERAVVYVLSKKLTSMQAGRMGFSTSEVGDLVADAVASDSGT